MRPDKRTLFDRGVELHAEFCEANRMTPPPVVESDVPSRLGTCAFYRHHQITIDVKACAAIGVAGPAWSYPGYIIDRTPYGVLQHEQGHAADLERETPGAGGAYFSDFSVNLRKVSGEPKLTNYCPNDAEWFAEMFRLFVTNSDLLRLVRPRTHAILDEHFVAVVDDPWRSVLREAPDRIVGQVERRLTMPK